MTDTKIRRFGHGAYEQLHRNEAPPSVEHARNFFLQTVRDVAPEVLDDLAKETFRLYRKTPAICYEAGKERLSKHKQRNVYDQIRDNVKWKQQRPTWKHVENASGGAKVDIVERYIWTAYERPPLEYVENQWRDPLGIRPPVPVDSDGSIAAFKASLFEWSRRHNLNDMWCRERAYETLDLWSHIPACRKAHLWQDESAWQTIMPQVASGGGRTNFDFVFSYNTLYPREGFRRDVKQRILEACEKELDAFLDKREQMAREGGMVATPQKHAQEHFEWLVRRQVQGMTCQAIFDLYQEQVKSMRGTQAIPRSFGTVRAVEKAVKELADFIGLTPRYAGRGRKPKTKTQ